jgi:hypothetical protein
MNITVTATDNFSEDLLVTRLDIENKDALTTVLNLIIPFDKTNIDVYITGTAEVLQFKRKFDLRHSKMILVPIDSE